MTQTEARKLAGEMGWIATDRHDAGAWLQTAEWVVIDPNSGEVFASRKEAD